MSTPCFVAYYRVSTDKQGRSGLGLEAQRAAVEAHVASSRGTVAAKFIEVESGRKWDRPQLTAALAAARAHRAVLVIAKLDRLARNVHFVSGLMESGVEFVAADLPTLNRLTVHILAAVAEEEARMISARTKAALAAANAVKTGRAQVRAADVLPFIKQARRAGATTAGSQSKTTPCPVRANEIRCFADKRKLWGPMWQRSLSAALSLLDARS